MVFACASLLSLEEYTWLSGLIIGDGRYFNRPRAKVMRPRLRGIQEARSPVTNLSSLLWSGYMWGAVSIWSAHDAAAPMSAESCGPRRPPFADNPLLAPWQRADEWPEKTSNSTRGMQPSLNRFKISIPRGWSAGAVTPSVFGHVRGCSPQWGHGCTPLRPTTLSGRYRKPNDASDGPLAGGGIHDDDIR